MDRNRLNWARARQDGPVLLIEESGLRDNVRILRQLLPGIDLKYALKCNPHHRIVKTFDSLGLGFEIASSAELKLLRSCGIPPERIVCFHPFKSATFLRELAEAGVRQLAVDCAEEIRRIAFHAPAREIVLRLEVDGSGSRVPLGVKFGCRLDEIHNLSQLARNLGLVVIGITMHVGSQCESVETWQTAIRNGAEALAQLERNDFAPTFLSIGGGLPVAYCSDIPTIEAICEGILSSLPRTFRGQISAEPGRALVASAGTLVATVNALVARHDSTWAILDMGTHHGLLEWQASRGGIRTPIETAHPSRPIRRYRLAGPTCDSADTLPGFFDLPELIEGDRIAFQYTGAYSTALSTHFNGFPPPKLVLIDESGTWHEDEP